ncbi:MAG: hypothetical protein ACK55I_41780, partial [bacterium]
IDRFLSGGSARLADDEVVAHEQVGDAIGPAEDLDRGRGGVGKRGEFPAEVFAASGRDRDSKSGAGDDGAGDGGCPTAGAVDHQQDPPRAAAGWIGRHGIAAPVGERRGHGEAG